MLDKIWRIIVRWRTLLFNALGAALVLYPEIVSAPEVLAIIPPEWHRWALASVFLINYWMRPRPAVLATDPEVEISKLRKGFK